MSLEIAAASGWSTGFGNLLDKELGAWWRTRRWLVHLVLWLVIVTGFVTMVSLEMKTTGRDPARGFRETMEVFFQVGGFFGLVGAVLVAQGSVVGERVSGTAAWVLTKPTTRHAFILSKLVAITGTFLLLSLVIPAFGTLIVSQVLWQRMPEAAHYAEAVGILALHQFFYIAFTLMLGTLFNSRGPVAGVALGFWIAGNILPNFGPKWLPLVMPWPLIQSSARIAQWQPVGATLWIPAAATAVWSVLFIAVALWRFQREEF